MLERDTTRIITASSLQHFIFCPTQCALIHIDQIWEENIHTQQGKILHQKTDKRKITKRKNEEETQGEIIYNLELGLSAKPDRIDWINGIPIPYEMKKGKTKNHQADEIQLQAAGLCLEEITKTRIPYGTIYYWKEKKSKKIEFTNQLRDKTIQTIIEVRTMLLSGLTPTGYHKPGCRNCSLKFECMPTKIGSM